MAKRQKKVEAALPEKLTEGYAGEAVRSMERASSKQSFNADEMRAMCKKIGLEYLDGYENRVFQYTLSDETYARDGAILISKGLDLKNYQSNPVVCRGHNTDKQIGMCLRVWYERETESVKAWILFLDDRVDRTGCAETTFRMVASGATKASSISFDVRRARRISPDEMKQFKMDDDYVVIIDESELYEFSIVTLPSNVNAMKESITRGLITREAIGTLAEENKFTAEDTADLIALIERTATTPAQMPGNTTINVPAGTDPTQLREMVKAFAGSDVTVNVAPGADNAMVTELANLRKLVGQMSTGKVLSKVNRDKVISAATKLREAAAALEEIVESSATEDEGDPAAETPPNPPSQPEAPPAGGPPEGERSGYGDFDLLAALATSNGRNKPKPK